MGLLGTLIDLSIMRKMASRLTVGGGNHASQLTRLQIVVCIAMTLNAVGILVAPGYKMLAVVEVALGVGLMAEGWAHYVAFERAVGDTFGLSKHLGPREQRNHADQSNMKDESVNATQIRRIRSAKIKMCRQVRLIFLCCHLMLGLIVLYSPLWPANAFSSGDCQVLSCHHLRLF
jgi:hypothetical protein